MIEAIGSRLAALEKRIAAAAERANRDPGAITLVAVSKRHPIDAIAAAIECGQRDFGENYARELADKRGQLASDLRWHFIGHLQRNKVAVVIGCTLIHAVDSERLLRAIDTRARAAGVVQAVLLAVNLGNEPQKSGIAASDLGTLLAVASDLESVCVDGLMTMPPLPDRPDDSREPFRLLRGLREKHATDAVPLSALSMGTTGDLEVAIEEGATHVRVGTAIFGPRPA